jgi:hypothetical protein
MITNDELNLSMKEGADQQLDLTDKEYAILSEKYMNRKMDYAAAKNDTQGNMVKEMINREVQADKQYLTKAMDLKTNITSTLTDTNKFGHNPTAKLGAENAEFLSSISKGEIELSFKGKNAGYQMTNGTFMSVDEIQSQLIDANKLDETARKGVKAIIDDSIRQAQDILPGQNPKFNYQKEFNNIKNKIINNSNLNSLANDRIFGNRVFKEDLTSAISLGTYEQMGLTQDQVFGLDPTKDGNISNEDALAITAEVMKNQDMLKDYLTEYFTKAVEQNYNNNLSEDVKQQKEQDDPYEFMR